MSMRELANTGKLLADAYRFLFGVGAVAVVFAQTMLTPKLTGWAEPWLGSLALTVAVLGAAAMLTAEAQQGPAKLSLAWALGCSAGLASFAIVTWRADVDPAIAWPTATLAGIATAVLVAFSETATDETLAQAANATVAREAEPGQALPLPEGALRAAVTLALAGATLALHAWQTDAGWYQPTRVVAGSLYVIVVPGWHLSALFDANKLDLIERGTLTVALSIVTVPLGLMWIYFLGGRIDFWATWSVVLALAVIGALLNQVRVLLSGTAQDSEASRGAAPLAWWVSRSVTDKAVLLSVMLWMLTIAALATRISL